MVQLAFKSLFFSVYSESDKVTAILWNYFVGWVSPQCSLSRLCWVDLLFKRPTCLEVLLDEVSLWKHASQTVTIKPRPCIMWLGEFTHTVLIVSLAETMLSVYNEWSFFSWVQNNIVSFTGRERLNGIYRPVSSEFFIPTYYLFHLFTMCSTSGCSRMLLPVIAVQASGYFSQIAENSLKILPRSLTQKPADERDLYQSCSSAFSAGSRAELRAQLNTGGQKGEAH